MFVKYRSLKRQIGKRFAPLRPIYDAWMQLIAGFSWILVRVILVPTFFTAILVYGIVLRLVQKDPLKRQIDDCESYWTDNVVSNENIDDFQKQY